MKTGEEGCSLLPRFSFPRGTMPFLIIEGDLTRIKPPPSSTPPTPLFSDKEAPNDPILIDPPICRHVFRFIKKTSIEGSSPDFHKNPAYYLSVARIPQADKNSMHWHGTIIGSRPGRFKTDRPGQAILEFVFEMQSYAPVVFIIGSVATMDFAGIEILDDVRHFKRSSEILVNFVLT